MGTRGCDDSSCVLARVAAKENDCMQTVSRRVVEVAVFGGARDGPVHQRIFLGAVPCALKNRDNGGGMCLRRDQNPEANDRRRKLSHSGGTSMVAGAREPKPTRVSGAPKSSPMNGDGSEARDAHERLVGS